MKNKLKQLIREAAARAHQNGDLPSPGIPEVEIGEPKAASHGDFSTNIAMQMASVQKMPEKRLSRGIHPLLFPGPAGVVHMGFNG